MDEWLEILRTLPLSRSEREVVKRYELDPVGRAFLPVADIMRAHRLIDESLALLGEGIERHPAFTVARVVYARELFQRGQIEKAWKTLASSPLSLHENVLAQKLRFKLAAVLGQEAICRSTYQHLVTHRMLDQEIKRFVDVLDKDGIEELSRRAASEIVERGVQIVLPEQLPDDSFTWSTDAGIGSAISVSRRTGQGQELDGFHVVSLNEVFQPGDRSNSFSKNGGIELDSVTLAEIFSKQGHYGKSLSMFRRMLKLAPHNELFKRRIAELARLEKEQKGTDLTVDPNVVDRMETIAVIDKQLSFLNSMLENLPAVEGGDGHEKV